MSQIYEIISQNIPEFGETIKWGTLVYTYKSKNVIALGSFKDKITINFFTGAKLNDIDKLFNYGLESKISRRIDLSNNSNIDIDKLLN